MSNTGCSTSARARGSPGVMPKHIWPTLDFLTAKNNFQMSAHYGTTTSNTRPAIRLFSTVPVPFQPLVSRSHNEHLIPGGMAERKSRDGNRQRNGAQTYRPGHATFVVENSPDNCKHGEDTQSNDQSSRQLIYRIYTSNPALNLLSLVFRH